MRVKRDIKAHLEKSIKIVQRSPCWEWQKSRDKHGYGYVGQDAKTKKAHRVSYETFIGLIPEGMCVLHRCDNPPCINPEHLFLGTLKQNALDRDAKHRGPDSKKLYCKRGHLFSAENLVVSVLKNYGKRVCKKCTQAYDNERYRLGKRKGGKK